MKCLKIVGLIVGFVLMVSFIFMLIFGEEIFSSLGRGNIDGFICERNTKKGVGYFRTIGFDGEYTITFDQGNKSLFNLGGQVLIYSIYTNEMLKSEILYFISDKYTFFTSPKVEIDSNGFKFTNIKNRFWKLYWEKGEYEHWASIDVIPEKDKKIFFKMENTLSNWVKSGKIKVVQRIHGGKLAPKEGKLLESGEMRPLSYYKME